MKKLFKSILIITLLSMALVAVSACKTKTVTIRYLALEGGTITGEVVQAIDKGKDGTEVTAAPLDGYEFSHWSDGETNPVRRDKGVQKNAILTAAFFKTQGIVNLTVKYEAGVGGYIQGDTTQSVSYGQDTATVEAMPIDNTYEFKIWSDGVESPIRTDENVRAGFSVKAIFSKTQSVNIEVKYEGTGEYGYIKGDVIQYVPYEQDATTVEAVANDGYKFAVWSDGILDAERTDTNITKQLTVYAIFTKEYPSFVQVKYIAGDGGYINDSGMQEVIQNVPYGQDATTVTAIADTGYTFLKWSDEKFDIAQRTDECVTEGFTVRAIFSKEPNPVELLIEYKVNSDDYGYIDGISMQKIVYGEDAETVVAHAHEGFYFVGWSDSEELPAPPEAATRTDRNITTGFTATAIFSKNPQPISLQIKYEAGEGGYIDGEPIQNIIYGQDAEAVEAVFLDGYKFLKWSDEKFDTRQRTDENITAEFTVTAIFVKVLPFYLEIKYEAGTGGYIDGDDLQYVDYGQDAARVEAKAYEGYEFVRWSDGILDTYRTDKNIMSELTLTAIFVKVQPVIVRVVYQAGTGGTIDGDDMQDIEYGKNAEKVKAVAEDGYQFVKWSDGVTQAERTDNNITAELSVIAIFVEIEEVFLQVNYIAANGGYINNPDTKEVIQTVAYGLNALTVTAVAEEGYQFVKWSDEVSTAQRTDENITVEFTVTAVFSKKAETVYLRVEYLAGIGGSIVGQTIQNVAYGQDASTVEAHAEEGYEFSHWSDEVTTAERTDENVRVGFTVSAIFSKIHTIYVHVSYVAGAGGSIDGEAVQSVSFGNDASTVTAVAEDGYEFVGWSDGLTDAERTDTNLTEELNVIAIFANKLLFYVNVKYEAGQGGSIQGNTLQEVVYGQGAETVVALPEDGYGFVVWSDGIETAERTDENITEELTVVAIFAKKIQATNIQIQYTSGMGGHIEGIVMQEVAFGQDASTVTAIAYADYDFVKWSDELHTAERTDTNITEGFIVIAIFSKKMPPATSSVKYEAGMGGYIQGNDLQNIAYGQSTTMVKALPFPGYEFVKWSDGLTDAERTDLNIMVGFTVIAIFSKIHTVYVQAVYVAGAGGRIEGDSMQSVILGQNATTVTAVALDGYEFSRWSDGYAFAERTDNNVTEELSVIAIFFKIQPTYLQIEYAAFTGGYIDGDSFQLVEFWQDATPVTAVAQDGYEFVKWSDDVYDAERTDARIEFEFTVYAIFRKITRVFLYEYNGATDNNDQENVILNFDNYSDTILIVPVKENFVFEGWYLDFEFNTQVSNEDGDIIIDTGLFDSDSPCLYAKWTAV